MNDEFLNQMIPNKDKTGCVVCSIGGKFCGKSYSCLEYLKAVLDTELFDKYILCLPNLNCESRGSYDFLHQAKKKKKIMLMEKYTPDVSRRVIATQKEKKNKGKMMFFFIDDASCQSMGAQDGKDNYLKDLLTNIRHYNVFLWIIGHGKNVFNPFLRMNTDIFLLYNMSNKALIKGLYEEFLSLYPEYPKFEMFLKEFIEFHNNNKFSCLYLNVRNRFKDYGFTKLLKNL